MNEPLPIIEPLVSGYKELNIGEFLSAGIMIVVSYFIINQFLPETWSLNGKDYSSMGVFIATIVGLLAGSALFYALLLSVFREEQALSVITHLKSKRQRSKVDK